MAQQLVKKCPGKESHAEGKHATLFDGKARQAQAYPEALCDAICKGIKAQIEQDRKGQFILAELSIEDAETGHAESQQILCNLATGVYGTRHGVKPMAQPTVVEDQEVELQQAWDDVSGRELDAAKVRKARAEEVGYIHKTRLYDKVPRSKATKLGAKVISVRWLDINKGDAIPENYRSRLLAR